MSYHSSVSEPHNHIAQVLHLGYHDRIASLQFFWRAPKQTPSPALRWQLSKVNEVNKGMASDVGDVTGTAAVPVVSVDYITIGNVSRWPSVLGVQEEKNGRRFSRPHTERVSSRGSRVRGKENGTPVSCEYRDPGSPQLYRFGDLHLHIYGRCEYPCFAVAMVVYKCEK